MEADRDGPAPDRAVLPDGGRARARHRRAGWRCPTHVDRVLTLSGRRGRRSALRRRASVRETTPSTPRWWTRAGACACDSRATAPSRCPVSSRARRSLPIRRGGRRMAHTRSRSSGWRSSTAARPPCGSSMRCASSTSCARRRFATIALYTEPERRRDVRARGRRGSLHRPGDGGGGRRPPRQRLPGLRRARTRAGGDTAPRPRGWAGASWPSSPEFAELCERLGHRLRRPRAPTSCGALGDKVEAKRLAEAAGVPVAPWSGGPGRPTSRMRSRHAPDHRLPADGQGGGRRRRTRHPPRGLDGGAAGAFESARAEAREAFGDDDVLLEKVISPPATSRCRSSPTATGRRGRWACATARCSGATRRSSRSRPAPRSPPTRSRSSATRRCGSCFAAGYHNAGTVEFLYEPETEALSFMEVNARLQVEHPVTEAATGADLVKLQLHIAAGGRLEGEPPPARGHAVEARLNAEDPALDFAPAPGPRRAAAAVHGARRAGRHRRRRRGTSSRPSSTR